MTQGESWEELMATARRAAAAATRLFPALREHREDVDQDAYVGMLEALRDDRGGDPHGFVYVCARNQVIQELWHGNSYRFRWGGDIYLEDLASDHVENLFAGSAIAQELEIIARDLATHRVLTAVQQAVLWAFYYEGKSTVEIGRERGTTQCSASKTRILALNRLRWRLGLPALEDHPGKRK